MKLAVIGLGMAARAHVAALESLHESVELTGLYMRNKTRRDSAAEAMQVKAFPSLQAIADDPETEAVLVLTPPDGRKEIVSMMATAGKHILMEKPLERTLPAATELVEIAEQGGILLGTVLQHRARQGARRLKGLLDSGQLGDVAMVRVDVPWWRPQDYYDQPGRGTYEQDGGGVLITQAIHVLDLMLHLLGPVKAVQAMLTTTQLHAMEAEDFASAGVLFESGAVGSICATTASFPGSSETIRVDGTLGSATLEGGSLAIHMRDGKVEEFAEKGLSGAGADPMAFPYDWHMEIIQNFVDVVEGRADSLIAPGRDALKVQRLIEAMERSSAEAGLRIALDSF
ncbi:Gfo/Idh/MocA family protein [Cohaesibacter haloalkalitolerans]|uniref:Gfo/Idh/MocA family protein n=1 Tax=Cohaesibacter haloalkalitolerans TaxID=1162980 RepID=UPI000E64A971|nr:Gfo/Idh/MocA family oxidoreductase [Cohaesibacter haloalkalitolerans]